MSDIDPREFKAGDWVLVWGQVSDGSAHPSDEIVRFQSHNEDYKAHINREHIKAADVPPFATRCTSLYETDPNRLVRCTLHEGHKVAHEAAPQYWNNLGAYDLEATS